MTGDNKSHNPGVIGTSGQYWREQRRFLLRNLKDFGFGKASMESIIQDEMVKLCSMLAKTPEVLQVIANTQLFANTISTIGHAGVNVTT